MNSTDEKNRIHADEQVNKVYSLDDLPILHHEAGSINGFKGLNHGETYSNWQGALYEPGRGFNKGVSSTGSSSLRQPWASATLVHPAVVMALRRYHSRKSWLVLTGCIRDRTNHRTAPFLIEKRFSVSDSGGSPSVLGGDKGMDISLNAGLDIQNTVHRVISNPRKRLQKTVGRHRPGIPMAAFVLVKRVAHPSVIPGAGQAHDLKSFVHTSRHHQVRGHLIFNSGPHFVAVDKGQRRGAATGPGAEQQTSFMAKGVGGPLGICVAA
jgi:hypothetical protein